LRKDNLRKITFAEKMFANPRSGTDDRLPQSSIPLIAFSAFFSFLIFYFRKFFHSFNTFTIPQIVFISAMFQFIK
jgi:hypothetical protein